MWQRAVMCRDLALDLGAARTTSPDQVSVPLYLCGRDLIVELLEAEEQRLTALVERQIDRVLDARLESRA